MTVFLKLSFFIKLVVQLIVFGWK